ncbi:MAG: hypothetical protein QM737_01785 [Ferruginibacter sp.]
MKTNFTKTIAASLASFFLVSSTLASVIVSPASCNLDISADKASNAFSPSFTSMDDIIIMERKANDFTNSFGKPQTLVLTAPFGWTFKPGSGMIALNNTKDLSAVSMKVSWTSITITYTVNASVSIDALVISGVQVQATDGALINTVGSIYRSSANPGTAMIEGIINTSNENGAGGTSFCLLSQTAGIATKLAFSTKPVATTAGTAFEQQPVIVTEDQFGNPTSKGLNEIQNVKIKLSSGTGSLSGTAVLNIGTAGGNGKVEFSDLQLSEVGAKKLIATSGSLSFAVTNEFTVTEEETGTKITSENSDDYDPDAVCLNSNNANIVLAI